MCVLVFSTSCAWNIFHYKNWARYDYKCQLVFMCSAVIIVRLYWNLNFPNTITKNTQTSNLRKFHPTGAELFHADGQNDMTKLIVDAPKKIHGHSTGYQLRRYAQKLPKYKSAHMMFFNPTVDVFPSCTVLLFCGLDNGVYIPTPKANKVYIFFPVPLPNKLMHGIWYAECGKTICCICFVGF